MVKDSVESIMVVSGTRYGKRSDTEDYRKTNRGGYVRKNVEYLQIKTGNSGSHQVCCQRE